ncbi:MULTISPECIES: hypothetical protein [unclassified Streptomyces]|uniref:hypothetical protein n=1 Tax=unclassified Streptomyces TaxID=2593676 RepID=UPI000A41728C|nr:MULTISPECIES: hypothetical protein [unclassified Streptomyces]MBT2379682.1 hypothetical protein [Streptomyces sp. ISL-111]MBT2426704.1 hypothetical protein [Streptomyces sp. ISL-112]MBT2463281.1 hypothetical protein [Streptomyces sp. ISL-63]
MTHVRSAAVVLVILLLLGAGAWASWESAHHVLLPKGRQHGVLTVAACGEQMCNGRYVPDGEGPPRTTVTIERSVAVRTGRGLPVVVKPGTEVAVRTGWSGGLHAWLPLGGAMLLAAPLAAGGLRATRTAWSLAGAGGMLVVATFLAV